MRKFLIVVDMQNDFVSGMLGSADAITVADNILTRIQREPYDYVIFTQDTHYEDYLTTHEGKKLPIKHCVKHSDGWEIISMLSKEFGYSPYCVEKEGFGYTHWITTLKTFFGFNQKEDIIEIVGLLSDICVISNALELRSLFPEADIRVIRDCVAGTNKEKNLAALSAMESCHIDII